MTCSLLKIKVSLKKKKHQKKAQRIKLILLSLETLRHLPVKPQNKLQRDVCLPHGYSSSGKAFVVQLNSLLEPTERAVNYSAFFIWTRKKSRVALACFFPTKNKCTKPEYSLIAAVKDVISRQSLRNYFQQVSALGGYIHQRDFTDKKKG